MVIFCTAEVDTWESSVSRTAVVFRRGELGRTPCFEILSGCLSYLPGMAEIIAGVEQTLSRRVPAKRRPSVGLDRVCARATLPLSGTGSVLRADSKTHAVLLLRCLRDFLLRCNCLVCVD